MFGKQARQPEPAPVKTMYNGHYYIQDMPAPNLFRTKTGVTIRVALPCDRSPVGVADIYVHRGCVKWNGGEYIDATYNILLVDNEYTLYYPMKNPDTGLTEILPDPVPCPVEQIYEMTNQAKANYAAHPIKHKHYRPGHMYRHAHGEWENVHPEGMIEHEDIVYDAYTEDYGY